jgi:hypothetical protein
MNILLPAQAGAQLVSLLIYIAIARWYAAPWLAARRRADALTALLWLHVFRIVALQIFSARQDGFPISMGGALEIVIGDVGGAIIAFAAIASFRRKSAAAIPLCWLLVIETAADTVLNVRGGIEEHLMGAASGVVWMILVFYVPAIIVSLGLLVWQLVTRRHESLTRNSQTEAQVA